MRENERRPRAGLGWEPQPGARVLDSMRREGLLVVALSVWQYKATRVISALEVAEYPDGKGDGPQWHLSFSRAGRRPGDHDLRRVQRAFGLVGLVFDEDNHHPGVARHLWVPVDPAHRVACQCKTDERTVVEPDGYRWTTPKDGPCSGCEFAALVGKPCFLHPVEMPVEAPHA